MGGNRNRRSWDGGRWAGHSGLPAIVSFVAEIIVTACLVVQAIVRLGDLHHALRGARGPLVACAWTLAIVLLLRLARRARTVGRAWAFLLAAGPAVGALLGFATLSAISFDSPLPPEDGANAVALTAGSLVGLGFVVLC